MAKRSDDERTRSALGAKLKALDGGKLTQLETKDVVWYDKNVASAIADATLSDCPKGTYCQMAGRAHDVVNKMAKHYRLDALLGDTVDLFDALESLHDLIAENSRMIQPLRMGEDEQDGGDIGDMESGPEIYTLQIRKLSETVRKLEIENARKEIGLSKDRGDAIDRTEFRQMLSWLSTRLQGFGQTLRRTKGGTDAQQTLNEFLETLAKEITDGELAV